jgi:hypothetical protein
MTRQESELGSLGSLGFLGSRGQTESGSEIAPGSDEESWSDSDSDSDLDSGDEGDHEVKSLCSGEGEGDAGTPGSSLAASASGTQLGGGCGHELQEEGSDC